MCTSSKMTILELGDRGQESPGCITIVPGRTICNRERHGYIQFVLDSFIKLELYAYGIECYVISLSVIHPGQILFAYQDTPACILFVLDEP